MKPVACFIQILVLLSFAGTMSTAFATDSASAAHPKSEEDARLAGWAKRWNANTIGFHLAEVNPSLVKHGSVIVPSFSDPTISSTDTPPVRVFVPLCGKTVDMAFLASHAGVAEVVGVDGIAKALHEFATEHPDLKIQPLDSHGKYEKFAGTNISLLKGDFFELEQGATGGQFDSIWDRASIVAIEPNLRKDYVDVMSGLVKPGGTLLVSTLERRTGSEEGVNAGPPFSVSEAEVRKLYESQDWVKSVTLLDEVDVFARNEKDAERFGNSGVTSMYELVFEIKAKE